MVKETMTRTHVFLPLSLLRRLGELAEQERRSVSKQVTVMLERSLKAYNLAPTNTGEQYEDEHSTE